MKILTSSELCDECNKYCENLICFSIVEADCSEREANICEGCLEKALDQIQLDGYEPSRPLDWTERQCTCGTFVTPVDQKCDICGYNKLMKKEI